MVMRMKRCSMLARERTAWRGISWGGNPHTKSFNNPHKPPPLSLFFFFLLSFFGFFFVSHRPFPVLD